MNSISHRGRSLAKVYFCIYFICQGVFLCLFYFLDDKDTISHRVRSLANIYYFYINRILFVYIRRMYERCMLFASFVSVYTCRIP